VALPPTLLPGPSPVALARPCREDAPCTAAPLLLAPSPPRWRDRAHARGLPIAQKNAAHLLDVREQLGTDFAVVEECGRHDECLDFTTVYGSAVLVIEYRRQDFERACASADGLRVVLRDLDLQGPDSPEHVRDAC